MLFFTIGALSTSFALRDDIMENVPICDWIYDGKQHTNYIAENI
jgi:hypothetical protein